MPDAINLGTLFADVKLDVSKLPAARAVVTTELHAIGEGLDRLATQAEKDSERIEKSLFSKGQEDALKRQNAALKKQQETWGQYGAAITNVLGGAFAGLAVGSAAVVKMSADYNQSMTAIQNNTTMTDKDLQQMKATVLAMGKESGASFDDLAQGYMHIANFGYNAAQSTKILRTAMEAAVATGAKTADTANILAASLHMFGLSGDDATKAMNVLHLAAAEGNMTLEQFTNASGEAFTFGAQLGLTITDVSAAFSALTRNGFDAAQAGTQVKAMFTHIIDPSKKAREEIDLLRKTTGVDLTNDFTAAGLKAKGLAGVLKDIQDATHGDAAAIEKLIPAMRGGIGAMSLAGKGGKDLTAILGDLDKAWGGKLDPTTQGYERSLKNLNTEIAKVTNEIKADLIPVGEKLTPTFEAAIPVIRDVASNAGKVADAFASLPEPIKEIALEIGATVIGFTGLNRGLDALGIRLPGIDRIFKNLRTDVGLATAEVEGLTTKLGLLESIGPIAITAVVSWEIGSQIGQKLSEKMQDSYTGELDQAGAHHSASDLRDARRIFKKSFDSPDKMTDKENDFVQKNIDSYRTGYGIESNWTGTYSDDDNAKLLDMMGKDEQVQDHREIMRKKWVPGPKQAAPTKPSATKHSGGGHTGGGKGDDNGDAEERANDHKDAVITRAQTAADQAQGAFEDASSSLREDAPGLTADELAARIKNLRKLSKDLADANDEVAATRKRLAGKNEQESATADFDAATAKEVNATNKRDNEIDKIKQEWYRKDARETKEHNKEVAATSSEGARLAAEQMHSALSNMASEDGSVGDMDEWARSWKRESNAAIDAGEKTKVAVRDEAQFMVSTLEDAGQQGTIAWETYVEEIKRLDKEIAEDNKKTAKEMKAAWADFGTSLAGTVKGINDEGKGLYKKTQAEAKETARNMRQFFGGVAKDLGNAAEDSLDHWRGFKNFFKEMGVDIKHTLMDIVKELTKNTLLRAFLGDRSGVSASAPSWGNLGAIFGKGGSAAATPPIAAAGAAAPGGAAAGMGGIGGLFGGLGAVGHILPWVGGGLLANQLLGNPLGKAMSGLKKIFRFSEGGNLPAGGSFVAEKGTGGEYVVPRTASMALPARLLDGIGNHAAGRAFSAVAAAGGMGGGGRQVHVHLHMDGSNPGQISSAQINQIGNRVGWEVRKHIATATPERL